MMANELNIQITFQIPNGSTIQDGLETPVWSEGATTWAAFDVKPPKGRDIYSGQTERTEQTRWIKIRYRTGIEPTWRIKVKVSPTECEYFEIVGKPIDPELRHRELYLELKVVE
jgi:SPP1 family predicted phage head-tail adaptor